LFRCNFVSAEPVDPTPDTTAPVITLTGTSPINLTIGDTYTDAGATAVDDVDSSVVVTTSSDVDSNTAGAYVITYTAKDIAGNIATPVTRTVNVNAKIPTPDTTAPVITSKDIVVKDNCIVTDTDGITYIFPEENSTTKFLGICALVAARDAKYINNFELKNDKSLGLYISSINNIKPGNTEYWALWLNSDYASCGIGCLSLLTNDTLSFVLSDWMTGKESTKILLHIISLESSPKEKVVINTGGGGYSLPVENKIFSIQSALDFLYKKQNNNGSFNSPMYTDWVAISAVAGKSEKLKISIINYLKLNSINSSAITDYERRAMALMALGINPYNGTNVNYINKIISSFDGVQIGDQSLVNDDIFGLIVLSNAGYTKNDEIIKNTVSFIVKKQMSNGSWGSVDMTAAAIESLNNFKILSGVSEAISKGELYLISEQKNDGSFGNLFSTSWAIQALSLDDVYNIQVDKAIKYLTVEQQIDGGLNDNDTIDNRIWVTSYAIPSVLKLSWSGILQSFSKEEKILPVGNIEIKEVQSKINQIKKQKIIKNIFDKKLSKNENPSNNLLSASANGSIQNSNTFFSIIHMIIHKIKAPFYWLFIRLGF